MENFDNDAYELLGDDAGKEDTIFNWMERTQIIPEHCFVCGSATKECKRRINKSMVDLLRLLYTEKNNSWVHIPTFISEKISEDKLPLTINSTYKTLRYFGLLDSSYKSKEDGNKNSGVCRINEKGIAFLKNNLRVPKHIITSKTKIIKVSDETIGVLDCDKSFDFKEDVLSFYLPPEGVDQYLLNLQ